MESNLAQPWRHSEESKQKLSPHKNPDKRPNRGFCCQCRRGSLDLTECPSVEVPGTGQKEHSNPTKRNGLIPSTSRHTRAKARASVPAAAPRRRTAKAKEEPDWNPTGNAALANPAAHTRRGSSSTGDKPDATADLSTSTGVVTVRPQRNTGRARRRPSAGTSARPTTTAAPIIAAT